MIRYHPVWAERRGLKPPKAYLDLPTLPLMRVPASKQNAHVVSGLTCTLATRQTDRQTDRYMVEKKHAPLTYDATTITSNLVLLYNAQTQTRPTDHPRHDQPDACSPQAAQPANQYTVPCRVSNPYPFAGVQTVKLHAVRARQKHKLRACLSGEHTCLTRCL